MHRSTLSAALATMGASSTLRRLLGGTKVGSLANQLFR